MNTDEIDRVVLRLTPIVERIAKDAEADIKKILGNLVPTVERVVRESVERSRRFQGSWGRAGRPAGSKNWGHIDYSFVVAKHAKDAPVCRWDYPNGEDWGRGFARAGEAGLLVQVGGPEYQSVKGREYFAHVHAPWKHEQQMFGYHDLAIARAIGAGHATPRQFTKESVGRDQMAVVIKYADACARFRAFEAFGLADYDPDCTEGHGGKFRPRWYKPTEKLLDLLIML